MIRRAPRPTQNFYILSNEIANDSRLTPEALGVLIFLLSKPDDWVIHKTHLQKHFSCGRQKMDRIFTELKKFGYMVEAPGERKDGQFQNKVWEITENPLEINDDNRGRKTAADKPQRQTDNYKELTIQKTDNTNILRAFDSLWDSFPVKANKKKAKQVWVSLCDKTPIVDPLTFAEDLKLDIDKRRSLNQQGFDKMHPTTYLNGERWRDDYPKESARTDFSSADNFIARHTDTSWAN